VLTQDRQVRRLSIVDVPTPVEPVTRVTVPKSFNSRNAAARRDLASTMRNALGPVPEPPRPPRRKGSAADDDEVLARLRRQLRSHPCHGCAEREDHARWAERWWRLQRETTSLVRRIEGRTNTIARVFDRVCELLAERGYLDGDRVTPHGERLRRIYTESDLLTAECLRRGVFGDLDAAGLAAVVSAIVYESRRDDRVQPRVPRGATAAALDQLVRIWSELEDAERNHRLDATPEPDLGLARAVHGWARGQRLEEVLADGDLAAGDFVRWVRQVIDLLDQIAEAAGDEQLTATARAAVAAVTRGVVAYSVRA
jgi:ATP-dependent RNA helicase HelY